MAAMLCNIGSCKKYWTKFITYFSQELSWENITFLFSRNINVIASIKNHFLTLPKNPLPKTATNLKSLVLYFLSICGIGGSTEDSMASTTSEKNNINKPHQITVLCYL